MTSRERWIVYPLLFLTFGITMRDKLWPFVGFEEVVAGRVVGHRLEVDQAECRVLRLTGRNGRDTVRLGTDTDGNGFLELLAADGDILARLEGDRTGGMVTAFGPEEEIGLVLGHDGDEYGVFAESIRTGRRMPLTLPWRFETAVPEQQEEPGEKEDVAEQKEPDR